MIIKLSSRYGDVYVNTDNITFFKSGQNGTIIFFGNTAESYTEVAERPDAVAKAIEAARKK